MRRREQEQDVAGLGVSMPIFLIIWLVCAVVAGAIWQNLVDNTPPAASGKLTISFPAMIVLSLTFGLPGAGLVCMAVDVFRRP